MIVVDASVILDSLLRTPMADRVDTRLFRPGETLHAPHLLDVEVAQVLRRYASAGDIDHDRGAQALADLADWPMRRYPHDLLLPRIWTLRDNLTAYDGAYVALSELLGAPLLTRDRKIANAPGHSALVELL